MRIKSKIKDYRTPLNFLNSTLFLHSISLITGFVTYRYVTPDYLGIWATFSTFTTIATFIRLGIPNGMNRELPYYLGKGNFSKAEEYASTTLAYSLFNIIVLLLIGLIFLITFNFEKYESLSTAYRYAALVFFFKVLIEPYNTYLSGTFRTSSNFDKYSRIQYFVGFARIITLPLVVFWQYAGYLLRELLVELFNAMLMHFCRPMPQIKPKFKFKLFKELFSIGFVVFLVSYASSFIETIPRLYILDNGSPNDLGIFSPVLIILSFVVLIPNTITQYLYPKFSYAYGKGCGRIYFWKKMLWVYLGSLLLGLIAAGLIYVLIDKIVLLFPNYQESVPYIKIVCLGMAFIGYKLFNVICVVLKEMKWTWIVLVVYAISLLSSLFILNSLADDILYITSWSMTISYILSFIVSIPLVYYITHKHNNENSIYNK